MANKKKNNSFLNKKISNRLSYTIIGVFIFILLAIGVYSYGTTNPPVFGHSTGELAPPASGCSAGQVLTWTDSGWACNSVSGVSGISGTGTTNYLTKFTGATSVGNSVLYETGGNIGIGTTNPLYKLHLLGEIVADPLTLNNPAQLGGKIGIRRYDSGFISQSLWSIRYQGNDVIIGGDSGLATPASKITFNRDPAVIKADTLAFEIQGVGTNSGVLRLRNWVGGGTAALNLYSASSSGTTGDTACLNTQTIYGSGGLCLYNIDSNQQNIGCGYIAPSATALCIKREA